MEEKATTQDQKHGRDMTRGSIPRHMLVFSMPMLAGNVIQTAYSIVNAVWVGQGLGKTALAAVTTSMPVAFMLIAIALGLTMGTSILVSQYSGARNWTELKKAVQTSTVVLTFLSIILLALGEVFIAPILRAMDTPPDVLPLAVSYMRIFLCGIPFTCGMFLVISLLRGVGDSKTPLYFQTGSLILTAILDPVLMFGWLGMPRLGLNGTALAVVITQALGIVALLIYLRRRDHVVAPHWNGLQVNWPMLWLILKIGLPSAVQQSLVSVGMMFITGLVNAYGENATAAFGAAARIDQIAFLPAMTFNIAVSTMVGQNLGAGRHHRVKGVFGWGVLLAGGITACVTLLALTIPHVLLMMFTRDHEVLREGTAYLRIVGLSYLFFTVMFLGNGVINGSGRTMVTTGITIVALWLGRVPLAVFLSHRMHRVEGIWYAILISSFISMSISLGCYFAGIWKHTVIAHRPTPEPLPLIEEETLPA